MSKKKVIVLIVAGLLVGLIGGVLVFIIRDNKSQKKLLNLTQNINQADEIPAGVLYQDEAGFSFYYPRGVEVSDETPADDSFYSLLVLTKDNQTLKISVADTKETKIEDYLKKNLTLSNASLYGATDLGGMSAKQYANGSSLFTLAIDQGVLYLIEGPKDNSFWEKTQSTIVETFTFKDQEKAATSEDSNNIIYEEEEVVE